MIGRWAEWKRFPKAERGEHIEAPIGPGIYEVREASTGALFAFGSADSVAQILAGLTTRPGSFKSWLGLGEGAGNLNLEYRTCADLDAGRSQDRGRGHDRPPRDLAARRGLECLSTVI